MIIDTSLYKEGDVIEKIDFKNLVEIEYFHASDAKEKKKALNIIRNNDFLQYHYFAQEYNVVVGAGVIALMSIKYNNIKMYIGFISMSSPTREKLLRGAYFGSQYLQYSYFRTEKLNSYVMARVVLLPSYRGLGLASFFIDETTKYMLSTPNFYYMEIVSNMFHNYYFAGKTFDSFFIDLRKKLSPEDYDDYFMSVMNNKKTTSDDDISNAQKIGYKGFSKLIGNMAFVHNPKYNYVLVDWYKNLYGIDIDFSINNEISPEDIMKAKEIGFPLVILKHSNTPLKKLTQNKEFKDQYLVLKDNQAENIDNEDWNE